MKAKTGIPGTTLNRREFMRALGVAGGGTSMAPVVAAADLNPKPTPEQLVRFPEKTDLILRTDRPPVGSVNLVAARSQVGGAIFLSHQSRRHWLQAA